MNRNDCEYTGHEKLLHDLKFSTILLTLYAIKKAKDTIHAVNRKRKSVLSFCKQAKVIFSREYDDAPPNQKDNIL